MVHSNFRSIVTGRALILPDDGDTPRHLRPGQVCAALRVRKLWLSWSLCFRSCNCCHGHESCRSGTDHTYRRNVRMV